MWRDWERGREEKESEVGREGRVRVGAKGNRMYPVRVMVSQFAAWFMRFMRFLHT